MSSAKITIMADDRETNGANPYFAKYIIANNEKYKTRSLAAGGQADVKLCVDRATTGDYNILIWDPKIHTTDDDPIIALVIERKTWKDLAASLKDSRAKEQHKGMLSVQNRTGCHLMYLIEGRIAYKPSSKVGRIPFANLDAKRRHLILRGIKLIQTRDQEHTAEMLVNLARDVWRLYQKGDLQFIQQTQGTLASYMADLAALNAKYRDLGRKSTSAALDIISAAVEEIVIPERKTRAGGGDVSDTRAEETIIPDILKESKIRSDDVLIERMWMCIPNVTNKSAPALMEGYDLCDLIAADAGDKKQYIAEIAELRYPSGTRIGEKRAKQIMTVAYTGSAPTHLEKMHGIHRKILAELPGITLETADLILAKYPLREICAGNVGEDDIALVKKAKRGTVGQKTADKIIELLS